MDVLKERFVGARTDVSEKLTKWRKSVALFDVKEIGKNIKKKHKEKMKEFGHIARELRMSSPNLQNVAKGLRKKSSNKMDFVTF